MKKQNSYRVINEDIAALRNIAWAVSKECDNTTSLAVLSATELLLAQEQDTRTAIEIWAVLAHPWRVSRYID